MKTLFRSVSFLFMFVLCLGFTNIAQAYTYDGPIDPREFITEYKCTVLKIDGRFETFLCKKGEHVVTLYTQRFPGDEMRLNGYDYKINGVDHMFFLEGDHYRQAGPESTENR